MIYKIHPEAEQDLNEIVERYLTRFGRQAAQRFLDEYQRVRAIVVQNPEMGTKSSRGRRTYPFKSIPYLLVYRAEQGEVTILIVRHQHRKPSLGGQRN